MKTNPLKRGSITEKAAGLGTVTREMVRQRAAELAIINGRPRQEVSESDWEQARRELTGGEDMDPREAEMESVPETERGDLVRGSEGGKVPVVGSEDEDDEGRSDNERLVEAGIEEAEHDQMLEAAEAPRKRKKRKAS